MKLLEPVESLEQGEPLEPGKVLESAAVDVEPLGPIMQWNEPLAIHYNSIVLLYFIISISWLLYPETAQNCGCCDYYL